MPTSSIDLYVQRSARSNGGYDGYSTARSNGDYDGYSTARYNGGYDGYNSARSNGRYDSYSSARSNGGYDDYSTARSNSDYDRYSSARSNREYNGYGSARSNRRAKRDKDARYYRSAKSYESEGSKIPVRKESLSKYKKSEDSKDDISLESLINTKSTFLVDQASRKFDVGYSNIFGGFGGYDGPELDIGRGIGPNRGAIGKCHGNCVIGTLKGLSSYDDAEYGGLRDLT